MSVKIKTIRGRQYHYLDVSQRVNGKVVTKSTYLGAVNPKRKRRGGGVLGGLTVPTFLMGALLVGVKAVRGELKIRTYREKPVEPVSVHRARQIAQKAIEGLDRKYAIDKTNAASFNASRARLPKEMQDEYQRAQMTTWKAVDAARPKAPVSPDMKAFSDRLAEVSRAQAEKTATAKGEAPAGDEGMGDS